MKILSYFLFASAIISTSLTLAQQTTDEAQTLMQLDRDFDKATAEKGVDGWVLYFAPNGSMLGDTLPPTTGRAAIRLEMEPALSDTNFSLRWNPVKADILMPGVLGYTVGRWERIRKKPDGSIIKKTGTYTSIWKKQPDGSWKIVLDTGSPD